MSERKVLNKYYPPDFDPAQLKRSRKSRSNARLPTITIMTPFSMRCTTCGEFICKGRKFNARKEKADEKYYSVPIHRFYIRCTACSAEITFRTDPENMDYECEKGAKRNFEPWREAKLAEETEEERLDRLEKEEGERDAMADLEVKTTDAGTEMAVADALDEIRMRNARIEQKAQESPGQDVGKKVGTDALAEQEDEETLRKALLNDTGERVWRLPEQGSTLSTHDNGHQSVDTSVDTFVDPIPSFQRSKKKNKKDYSSALGIKKR